MMQSLTNLLSRFSNAVMGRVQKSSGSGRGLALAFGFGFIGFHLPNNFRVYFGFGFGADISYRVRVWTLRVLGFSGF